MPATKKASAMSCPAAKPLPIMGSLSEGMPASPAPANSMSPAAMRAAHSGGGGAGEGAGEGAGGAGASPTTCPARGTRQPAVKAATG